MMVLNAIKFGERPVWRSTSDTINSKVFIAIVKDAFGYNGMSRRRMDTVILQDNAPVHRSKETTTTLSAIGLQSIFIPANSPDLNPIENLFGIVKRNWHKAKRTLSMQEKLDFILKNYILQSIIDNLVMSMPDRLSAVINSNGQSTKDSGGYNGKGITWRIALRFHLPQWSICK
nr:unnamed protein product [Spirometra erinaceieuropaei]